MRGKSPCTDCLLSARPRSSSRRRAPRRLLDPHPDATPAPHLRTAPAGGGSSVAKRLLANNANSRLATTVGFTCGRARTPALRGRKLHKVRLPPPGRARQTAPVTPVRRGQPRPGILMPVSETSKPARQRLTNDVSHCRAAAVVRLRDAPRAELLRRSAGSVFPMPPRPAPAHSAAPGKRRQQRLRAPGQGSSLRRTLGR
ncbi:hypothetical protein BDD21_5410 [Thiocapsa rosea]|uniref:Uncharacterized protein n=1 Tax=Thiocapsa rosea TaxID=69360 RepID=A0A495ULF3_9GAMM|nr:hypothetical protein BDD21_5410 [Thiocapsa rosea]